MGKAIRLTVIGIVGIAVIGIALYTAGYRVTGPGGRPILSSGEAGSSKNSPGWRRSANPQANAAPQPGSGGRRQMAQADQSAPAPGSQGGGGQRGGGQRGGGQRGGGQSGFGPSGDILLPLKVGTTAIPVAVSGKEKASFVGQDLADHVGDTVVATADGPRKGWAVAQTLKYLGVGNYKEVTLIGANGKKVVVPLQQITDQRTIPLFTYDESGQLMVVSGPIVKGTHRGNVTLEGVKQTVAGRTDLLNVSGIQKVEVSG